MRVEIVFDDRQAGAARSSNGLANMLDLLIPAGSAKNRVLEAADHHVAQRETSGLEEIDAFLYGGFRPGNPRAATEDVLDAKLFDPSHARRIERGSGQKTTRQLECNFRCLGTFTSHAQGRRRDWGPRQHRCSYRLQRSPPGYTFFHVFTPDVRTVPHQSG